MLLAALAADPAASTRVRRLREAFADCLPERKPAED
jgi:hypothetical protein